MIMNFYNCSDLYYRLKVSIHYCAFCIKFHYSLTPVYLVINRCILGIFNVVSCSRHLYYKDAVGREIEIFYSICAVKFDGMISLDFPYINCSKGYRLLINMQNECDCFPETR